MKRDMINISLQRYGTRMLRAGDTFEATRKDARVLHALKKARYAESGEASADPESESDELVALRHQYQEKTGKRPFNGWHAEELRQKIAAAGAAER